MAETPVKIRKPKAFIKKVKSTVLISKRFEPKFRQQNPQNFSKEI